jgi:hypothetical protein
MAEPNVLILGNQASHLIELTETVSELGGIEHALWLPVRDHALLFHLSDACYPDQPGMLQGEPRAHLGWMARVMVGGRSMLSQVYALSCGGAYLITDRPSVRGSEGVLERSCAVRWARFGAKLGSEAMP